MAWQLYKTLKYDANSVTSARWDSTSKGRAIRFGDLIHPISHAEERELFRGYREGPRAYEILWLVRRPGGSVYDRAQAVRFFHKEPAMLWKLAREKSVSEPETITRFGVNLILRTGPQVISSAAFKKLTEACLNPKPPSAKLVELFEKHGPKPKA